MSDKKDDEKKDDEEKEEEPEEEEEEEEDDDESSDDENELDEDLFDIETGEPFGEMEQSWSMIHFNDKKHMKYFKYARDRTAKDIKELSKKRRWKCEIKNVRYLHKWNQSDENDIFLKFFVGYNFLAKKVLVKTSEKDPETGRRIKKKVWKPRGKDGLMYSTDFFDDITAGEEKTFNGFTANMELNMSYLDMYDHKIRVEVWDFHSYMPNERMGVVERQMVHIARDSLNQVWDCNHVVTIKRRQSVFAVGQIKFVCILQEVLDFELQLQNWTAEIDTKMMQLDDEAAKDEEQSRVTFMTYKLGKGLYKSKVPAGRFNSKKIQSKDTALEYRYNDAFAYPSFRTMGKMKFKGTRTELEDEVLQVKVWHRNGYQKLLIGKGHIGLEGASIGSSLSTSISWAKKQRKMDPLKSGNVSGSVDVNCPKSTLWREYSQKGVAQPMELKVYKPHERCYLCIRIIKANGLRGVNPSGLSDPYVTVDWGNMSQQTATMMDNCNPEYGETLYFPIKARMSDMPQQDEFDKFPFARINVWDFDEAGDSDNLGSARFYLHDITGPRPYKPYKTLDVQNHPRWKASVPKKRVVKFRRRRGAPLREHTILTRRHIQTSKLEGLPAYLDSSITIEGWFHGPGFIGEDKKPKGTSTHYLKEDGTRLLRGGDLIQIAHRPRDRSSEMERKQQEADGEQPRVSKARVPAGLFFLNYFSDKHKTRIETPVETQQIKKFLQEKLKLAEFRRRIEQYGCEDIIRGNDQYMQECFLPKMLIPIVPPYQMVDPDERKYLICLDSRKPITSMKVAKFVSMIEFEFADDEVDHFGSAGPDSWFTPDYFLKARKGDVQAHALLMVCLLLGIKIDAWVCIGEAFVMDALDGKRQAQHQWVLTRESTSIDCQKWGDDEEYRETGSVKFWEVALGKPIAPPMANRWEGRDDEKSYQIAIGKYKEKKMKKKRRRNKEVKMRRKRKSVVKEEGSDEDDLPQEEDMLTFMDSVSHKMRTDADVKTDGIFLHGAGLGGEAWGKADERVILKDKANDFEKARQADKAAKDKAEAEYRAQLRAMLAEEYHERQEFILEIDNVYKTISASETFPYKELFCVFNHKQMFVNNQRLVDPTKIGYDLQLEKRGGWLAVIHDEPYESPMKIKVQPALAPVSLSEQMSDENVALLEHEMQENIEAAISNHRYALNLETNWEGNEIIKPILVKFIEARLELQLVPKVYDHGWRYMLEDEGRPGFGIEPKDFRYRKGRGENIYADGMSLGLWKQKQYRKKLKTLMQSVPPGFVGKVYCYDTSSVDVLTVRSHILSHEYEDTAPWDRTDKNLMYALATTIVAWPNKTASAHMGLMVIYEKDEQTGQ